VLYCFALFETRKEQQTLLVVQRKMKMKKLMMVILSVGAAYADVKGKSKATKASVTIK